MNPAEHNDFRIGFGRFDAQLQRIPADIRHILNLGRLIIVGQQNGPSFFEQSSNRFLHKPPFLLIHFNHFSTLRNSKLELGIIYILLDLNIVQLYAGFVFIRIIGDHLDNVKGIV